MDHAFIDRFVDQGNGRREQLAALRFVVLSDRGAKFFDLSPQFAAVRAVDLVTFCVLSNAFFS